MSLKTLKLHNWCCFADFTLEFDPLCTVIVGGNGRGKSALQRALLWVCFNQWDGPADAFILHGQDYAHVTLETDKHTIERLKGRKDGKLLNLYRLDGADLRFDTVNRRSVPPAITQALNLGPDNFQLQHDPQYWFALSSGEVARALNRIVNLEAIDLSLANVASQLRLARAEETVCERRLESWQKITESTAWTLQAHRDLQVIEGLETEMGRISARIDGIASCQLEATRIASLRDRASQAILAGRKGIANGQRAIQQEKRVTALIEATEALQEMQELARTSMQEQADLQAALKTALAATCPLCGK